MQYCVIWAVACGGSTLMWWVRAKKACWFFTQLCLAWELLTFRRNFVPTVFTLVISLPGDTFFFANGNALPNLYVHRRGNLIMRKNSLQRFGLVSTYANGKRESWGEGCHVRSWDSLSICVSLTWEVFPLLPRLCLACFIWAAGASPQSPVTFNHTACSRRCSCRRWRWGGIPTRVGGRDYWSVQIQLLYREDQSEAVKTFFINKNSFSL